MSTHDFENDQENWLKPSVPDPLYAPDTEGHTEYGEVDGPDHESIEIARAAVEEAKTESVMNHFRV